MKSLLCLLYPESTNDEVEDAIEKDDYEDEDVTIVFSLVDCHDETESLHEECEHEEESHQSNHSRLLQS